jgi:hypothetical protein
LAAGTARLFAFSGTGGQKMAYRVLRLDADDGFFKDVPGLEDFSQSYRAIHAAQAHFEKSNTRTIVHDSNSNTVWDSKTDYGDLKDDLARCEGH